VMEGRSGEEKENAKALVRCVWVCVRRKENESWSSSQSAPGRTKGSEGLVLVFFWLRRRLR
jgi:hypothetical protein